MRVPWYLMAKGKGGGGYKTASGSIVSVNDALAAPLRSLRIGIDPVQDLHGFDSPWPAGGGKNLVALNVSPTREQITNNVSVEEQTDRKVVMTSASVTYACLRLFYPLKAGTYTASVTTTSSDSYEPSISIYNHASPYTLLATGIRTGVSKTFTVSEDINIDIRLFATEGRAAVRTVTFSNFQLESGSTATPYAPYSNICPISGWTEAKAWVKPTYDPTANPTATLQLGDTYYGGTLDVVNGVLTVTHKMVNFDNYTGTISKSASAYIPSGRAFYWIKLSGSPNPGGDGNPNHIYMKSSIYDIQDKSYSDMFQLSQFAMSIGRDTSRCMVGFNVDDSLSTVDLFRAWLQSASCDVWYPLATPITIPLTPQEISTLQGTNNLWADTGDVTVEYLSAGGANPDLMKLAVAFMGR